jgi:hypothetical protein
MEPVLVLERGMGCGSNQQHIVPAGPELSGVREMRTLRTPRIFSSKDPEGKNVVMADGPSGRTEARCKAGQRAKSVSHVGSFFEAGECGGEVQESGEVFLPWRS